MKLITIRTYKDGISAHIMRNKLESEDIACFVHDENIVTLNALYQNAVGGVKLVVNEEDVEKALQIIEEVEHEPFRDEKDQIIACPNCSSEKLISDHVSMKDVKSVLSVIISFLFMVFPLYYKSVYKCKSCGHEFSLKKK